ncbi:NAD(P)/FAD-dependent oxidoreductase [Rhodococcus sp. 14C212]|nr:NAD(P)/FAD-dependent oxidoreductase [Rhodococcus sp. 14C212]
MTDYDALVIGGGQSGLAAARALSRQGLDTAILEAGDEPVGSWPRYYDSLVLFSPGRYSSLPGMAFPGGEDRYPRRDEVIDYLRRYADTVDADILTHQRVDTVEYDGTGFTAHTAGGDTFTAPRLVAATGSFDSPYVPRLPGLDTFTGTVLHASEYREPTAFAGQHVIVVGAGNSAVQIAVELAEHAEVTLASRNPPKYLPQEPLGRPLHFWATVTGFDAAPIGPYLRTAPTQRVLDTGRYRRALTIGNPVPRSMFTSIDGTTVNWPDGTTSTADSVLLATGYAQHLPYLVGLGALDSTGRARHRGGISTTHPGLAYLGIDWQRTPSSASLRGVGRDAEFVAARLARTRKSTTTGLGSAKQ